MANLISIILQAAGFADTLIERYLQGLTLQHVCSSSNIHLPRSQEAQQGMFLLVQRLQQHNMRGVVSNDIQCALNASYDYHEGLGEHNSSLIKLNLQRNSTGVWSHAGASHRSVAVLSPQDTAFGSCSAQYALPSRKDKPAVRERPAHRFLTRVSAWCWAAVKTDVTFWCICGKSLS